MVWSKPKSRSIGLFTDLRLFAEALELASQHEYISKNFLIEELAQRLKGLLSVDRQSARGMEDLIRESRNFGWIEPLNVGMRLADGTKYRLTKEGEIVLDLSRKNRFKFLRHLTTKMHNLYVVPGWFVHRIWSINPEGQGEVVIPAPPRDWSTTSRKWEDKSWTNELEYQTLKSLDIIKTVCPGALPIDNEDWIFRVKNAWDRLGNLKQRKVAKPPKRKVANEKGKMRTYTPRLRLAMAMREATVKYLFSNKPPNLKNPDFYGKKDPLEPRTYMAWCPRLEALELIFYTDVHAKVPGRIIFPTSVFRKDTPYRSFESVEEIKTPEGETLYIHRPLWEDVKEKFYKILVQEHRKAYTRVGSLYVPLLDIRDEICRQLRISAANFDVFMEKVLRESTSKKSFFSISVETDIREDQRSASRLIRRPVFLSGTPHSLIAITEIQHNERCIK